MSPSSFSVFLAFSVLFTLLQTPALAVKKSYIVYLGAHSHGGDVTTDVLHRVAEAHYEFLGSFLGSKESAKDAIFYSYKRHINGFAANLEEEDAADIAKDPNVVSVFLNQMRQLHTTHSWEFLSLEKNSVAHSSSLWRKARYGEDIIIANIDSGVWPESKSFSDEGLGPIPSKWKGNGVCQFEENARHLCNKKLIGARFFNKGYTGKLYHNMNTSRDFEGHGTHTLSTAGGSFVPGANVNGLANGTAKGGSPKARVAAYKACYADGCFDSDLLKAMELAIHDGVDVISVSIGPFSGGGSDYFMDAVSIGAFHAAKNGIAVVCSAGNSGPDSFTVSNVSPWILTVAASTTDRDFEAFAQLKNGLRLKGKTGSKPAAANKFYPLITGVQAKTAAATNEDALVCLDDTLDHKKVNGKILVCVADINPRVEKGHTAAKAGAAGMILCNDKLDGESNELNYHVLPAIDLGYKEGLAVFSYINSTREPMAFITATETKINLKPAPVMASWSSRGPNTVTPEILKPDVTAPGVDILAAFAEVVGPTGEEFDNRKFPYVTLSGTSMSCPHVSGIVGLLKAVYPKWSQAAIRSAIMTTARTRDNTNKPILNAFSARATPLDYGAGHVHPTRAMNPGLVYDLTTNDYLDFLCGSGYNQTMLRRFAQGPYKCPKTYSLLNFNYPSITVPKLSGSVTVTRTVTNVGGPGKYVAHVREPLGISVSVEPSTLKFLKIGEEKSFKMTLKEKKPVTSYNYTFGELDWSDGRHHVRSPIVVSTLR